MDILIQSSKSLKDIRAEFQKRFPFLKLEFYSNTHKQEEISGHDEKIHPSTTIAALLGDKKDFEWHINGLMTVAEVETAFQDKLHIGVQVFRKSGINWLQTGATDNWTLAEQNAKGREMSKELPPEKPMDYKEADIS